MIRLNGYGSFNFNNGRKQANLLDTSFLNYPGLNPTYLFSSKREIPAENVNEIVADIGAHFTHIREAVAKREVYVLDCVLEEISALSNCIDTWRRHLVLSYAPVEYRYGLNAYNIEYRKLMAELRNQQFLDPRHQFSASDAREYNYLMEKVRENSGDLYDSIKTQKIHSDRGRKLETDRHLAAMMLFYNKDRDVKLFGNDRDVSNTCQNTGDALLAEGMHPSHFSIYTVRCPRPDEPYRVGEIILRRKSQAPAVPQKSIGSIVAA